MIDWNSAMNEYIKAQPRQSNTPSPDTFRCSSLSGCIRSCVKLRANKQPLSTETLKHFKIGTLLHRFIQQEVALGYVNEPIEMEKNVSLVSDGITLTGHVDCLTTDTVYDFKSTSNINVSLNYPTSLGYIMQLSAYAHATNKSRAVLVYVDKRNLNIVQKEIEILPLSSIISFCKQVQQAEAEYRQTNKLPPPCSSCFNCKQESLQVKP